MSISRLTRLQHALASLGIFPGSGGESGGSAASLIHQASVTLDNDDILDLGTGVEIAGDPGVGRRFLTNYLVISGVGFVDHPYTVMALGASLYLRRNSDTALALIRDTTDWGSTVTDLFTAASPLAFLALPMAFGISPDALLITAYQDRPTDDTGHGPVTFLSSGVTFTGGGDPGNTLAINWGFFVYDPTANRCLTTDESGWDADTRTFS